MKNLVLLENDYSTGDLKSRIADFVEYYSHRQYHESLSKLTPADVYYARGQTVLQR